MKGGLFMFDEDTGESVGSIENIPDEKVREFYAMPNRRFIAGYVLRAGVSLFNVKLEWNHFDPRTDANDDFLMVVSKMEGDHAFSVVSIPEEKLADAEAIAEGEGLRLAQGVPGLITPPSSPFQVMATINEASIRTRYMSMGIKVHGSLVPVSMSHAMRVIEYQKGGACKWKQPVGAVNRGDMAETGTIVEDGEALREGLRREGKMIKDFLRSKKADIQDRNIFTVPINMSDEEERGEA